MSVSKTSLSHPLRIDAVAAPGGGLIGMTFCPGKKQRSAVSGTWDRDLATDMEVIRAWGANDVATLMEEHELAAYGVPQLGDAVTGAGMAWHHLPIVDADAPRAAFETAWAASGTALRARLQAGGRVLLHCRGGLGRTGTVAARLLVELGVDTETAIRQVRQARPGAIENAAQARHVRGIAAVARSSAAVDERAWQDRARGAMLGLAVGDALGTTLEFSRRLPTSRHTEMTGGGPFGLRPGQWTDDTSMALALADSLAARPGFDAADLMDRFTRWWKQGEYSCTGRCFDIGITTRQSLSRYASSGNPEAGFTDEQAAGNGSLMRLAPVVLHALRNPVELRRIAAAQSRTTHGEPQAVEACVWFADLLRRAILGEPKADLLTPSRYDGHPAMRDVAAGTWRGLTRESVSSSGYVIATLQAALWAVERTQDFEAALVLAVNLGDDTDTVGAVTGQLAGALYGLAGIPERWLAPLAWRPRIATMADSLSAAG